MKKPTMNFRNLDAAQLLQFAEVIHEKMELNSDIFATPAPDLATLLVAGSQGVRSRVGRAG